MSEPDLIVWTTLVGTSVGEILTSPKFSFAIDLMERRGVIFNITPLYKDLPRGTSCGD